MTWTTTEKAEIFRGAGRQVATESWKQRRFTGDQGDAPSRDFQFTDTGPILPIAQPNDDAEDDMAFTVYYDPEDERDQNQFVQAFLRKHLHKTSSGSAIDEFWLESDAPDCMHDVGWTGQDHQNGAETTNLGFAGDSRDGDVGVELAFAGAVKNWVAPVLNRVRRPRRDEVYMRRASSIPDRRRLSLSGE